VATTLRAGLIIVLGALLFQIPFTVSSFASLFAVFTLTMTALYGLGMVMSSLFLLFGRAAWHLTQILHEPVYFIAGFYFPVKTFGFGAALAASALPLTLGLDAIRQLTFASGPTLGFLSVRLEIAALSGLSVVFLVIAKYCLDRMERSAIREGTLTDRRG